MKKRVAVTLVITVFAIFLIFSRGAFTGLQVLELPEPPPVPGMEKEALPPPPPAATPTATPKATPKPPTLPTPVAISEEESVSNRLQSLEKALTGLQEWMYKIEEKLTLVSDANQRLDGMQSQIDGMKVDMDNLRMAAQRPYVEQPFFFDELGRLSRRNTILSITLSLFVLLIVIAMIASSILQRKKDLADSKRLVRQYLLNYQKAGYRLETLRMHLLASGWSENLIDEVIRTLPK